MKQLFALLLGAAFFCGAAGAGFAQSAPVTAASCPAGTTFVKGYTKKDGTAVAPYCKTSKSKSSSMSAASPAAAASAAPAMAASTAPKSSKKKSTAGAMAAPAMASAAPAAAASAAPAMSSKAAADTAPAPGSTACPEGKSYVHGYTKQNGTKVAGYCRKSPSKKS